ncbi:UDP-glucose 4-epimerase GalE [Candidatus Peregrinibacteria bacterium]|nr:UDP-glucose 4-epimerase GalE [bacterium]NCS66785.1 UDP-glucose 4-epimerase GalE [Candidatus Peregrinibacteria bacterium]PIQ41878.1 MAG: UDP-glucose 4-epimerase GalE [Candidatus Gracilibacteria bacterium CG12_big_fil_rev_8_21_14_0_65_38_15]
MKVLVTGGMGYIGSHVSILLLEAGHDVAILDNLSNSSVVVLDRIKQITTRLPEFYNMDVRDTSNLELAFIKFHPDAVIHFAGLKAVGESVIDPLRYYEWNVMGSVVLLQVMNKYQVKKLVFSSSACVYGDVAEMPITEISCIAPTNPYGQTKAMIEQILADLVSSDQGWSVARLRYFNPAGAHISGLIGEDPNGIPNNLPPYISQVAVGKLDVLKIFGGDYPTPDGTGVRDYIHVMDLARGHLSALNYLSNESGLLTVNLGTGHGYSVLEMVKAFEIASGKKVPYRIAERRSGDVAISFADPSRAEQLLGWKASLGLNEMCRDQWHWQSKNPNGYRSSCAY